MTKYNFETRELVPYREDWNRGGNVKISGALWYIKEKDGLYLKIDEDKIVGNAHLTHDYCLAKGFPAALLALGAEVLGKIEFNALECYQAFCREMEPLFPQRSAYHVHFIIEDWEETLQMSLLLSDNPSGYMDRYMLMKVGVIIRDLFNPFKTANLEEKINVSFYYTCRFQSQTEPQFIRTHKADIEERLPTPIIYKRGLNQSPENFKIQAEGFLAAIINLAICYDWQRRWSRYNFVDKNLIERINKTYNAQTPLIDIANLDDLSFDLPEEVETLCKTYMFTFKPIIRKVWKLNPEVQLECIEGDNFYTYMYAHEISALEDFMASELYANLTNDQKRTLVSYSKRFMEWLVKNYPITIESQHRVMKAMGKDMPPIQLTIHNDVQITQASEPEEEKLKNKQVKRVKKFAYIISENHNEIKKIHKRIELHLSSPAKLRDELLRLDSEGAVSLPMDKPTAIIRAVRDVWGVDAPKVRSFVTTWGRRV